MKILVDTHTWLWMLSAPERIPEPTRNLLADPSHEILVSAASAWEIAIKHALGRLDLPEPPRVFVPTRLAASGCLPLAVEHPDALEAGALPLHHRDPFDRLLVAQARNRAIPLCSGDGPLGAYEVELLWG